MTVLTAWQVIPAARGDLSVFGTAHGGTDDQSVAVIAQRGEVAVASVKYRRRLVEQFGVSAVHGHGLYVPTHLWGQSPLRS